MKRVNLLFLFFSLSLHLPSKKPSYPSFKANAAALPVFLTPGLATIGFPSTFQGEKIGRGGHGTACSSSQVDP